MKFNLKFLKLFSRAATATGSDFIWGRGNTLSLAGTAVTGETALAISSVYACVRIISETLASLPLILYKKLPNGGKERADTHYLYPLLHDRPNNYQSSFAFREYMQAALCLRGNAYCQIIRNKGLQIVQLISLPSDKMEIKTEQNPSTNLLDIYYEYRLPNGTVRRFSQEDILHIQGLSSDGFRGKAILDLARESFGLALAEEKHAAKYFGNAATPSGVLEHPGKLGPEAAKTLRNSFENLYSGADNAHKVAILEEGMKWQAMTLTNEQSQFIESRKFQVVDICRWFRVPPHMVGELDRATFTNIEHQSLEFVIYSMRPWFVRWEQALNYALLSQSERETYFFEFLVDGLLRGDIKTRYEAYATGRNNGWLSVDEIRAMENMNPLDNDAGKHYLVPLNMKVLGEASPSADSATPPNESPQDETQINAAPLPPLVVRETIQPIINLTQGAMSVDVQVPPPESKTQITEVSWEHGQDGKRKAIITKKVE